MKHQFAIDFFRSNDESCSEPSKKNHKNDENGDNDGTLCTICLEKSIAIRIHFMISLECGNLCGNNCILQ